MSRPGFLEHLHPPAVPAREAAFRYTFGLGGMAVFLFVVLALTGVTLMFQYVPTAEDAAASIRTITFVTPYGWLLRNLHYWAGQLLLLTVTLHLLRVVMTGAYKPPRRFNWLLGVGLLVLVLLLNFTGYVLRWDADTNWALTVGINLVRETPLIGPWLYELLVGAPAGARVATKALGDSAVLRFYTWHVVGLAVPALGLIAWHAFRVRHDGGISHRFRQVGRQKAARIQRRQLLQREGLAMLAISVLLLCLALVFDAPLGDMMDAMEGREVAQAPWFFTWVQALLRFLPTVVAGVGIPLLLVLLLASLPWLFDRNDQGVAEWFNTSGRRAQLVVLLLAILITGLTLWETLR